MIKDRKSITDLKKCILMSFYDLWSLENMYFHGETVKLCDFLQNHQHVKDKSEEEKRQLYLVLGRGGRYSGKWGNMWPL